ncbi:fumarylacetoacetate hydrolase family protein [Paenisporosarcina sp. FSL H8-0542]|uniref:fumarylacetoacetate hydrolase family protein n=1 Tax=Paenisporosarcina sp. FSL H8-0542 TaxID=2921401 RepID=UPI00315A4E48
MKIVSFRYEGQIRFGPKVKKEEAIWDVVAIQQTLQVLPDFPQTIVDGIEKGMDFVEQMRKLADAALNSEEPNQFKRPFTSIEWLSPIPRTPKNIFGVGRNYAEHAKEMGSEAAPEHLMIFTKSPTTIAADGELLSVHSDATSSYDYEGELAVVISKKGENIPKKLAYDHVFGYTIANDLTARDLQKKHQQFFLGKSLKGSCPMGPYLVTKDELPNPQNLSIVTKVNDEVRQNGHTDDMIFSVEELIAQISALVTLEPGDVILTGTPSGVGKGFNPPKFLVAGDTVKVSVEGIGTLVNRFE